MVSNVWKSGTCTVLTLALAACGGGDSPAPVANTEATTPVYSYVAAPLVAAVTTPESDTASLSASAETTVTLSDGSAVRLPALPGPAEVGLERQTQALTAASGEVALSGSMRVATLSVSENLPENYRASFRIPASEYGTLGPETLNVIRESDLLTDGVVTRNVQSWLPVRFDTNGDLLFTDPYLPETVAAALADAPVPLTARALAATATTATATVRYGIGSFQSSLNWAVEPQLVRMVPTTHASVPAFREPLSRLTQTEQTAELNKCSQNIIVLVHGHNEAEGGGFIPGQTIEPWGFRAKRDTWTLLYKTFQNDTSADFSRGKACTTFYEYVYPTYRPIFKGNGNLGDDLARQLGTELTPIIEKNNTNHVETNLFIVAHSMGGLVSRAAINRFTPTLHDKFQKLVTWGTPHRGSIISSFRYAFAGPYTNVGWSKDAREWSPADAGSIVLNVGFFKRYLIRQQLDTPGARDLRWDNIRPLGLDEFFERSTNSINFGGDYNDALWNLQNGKALYNSNLAAFNSTDYYRTGVPANRLDKAKYHFIYGVTSKFLRYNDIALGATITYLGTKYPEELFLGYHLSEGDGAGPVISMVGEGLTAIRQGIGDIDHEEYFGAPDGTAQGLLKAEAKGMTTATETFKALEFSDASYACPRPTITSLSLPKGPVGTSLTVNGSHFGTERGQVLFGFGYPSSSITTATTITSWSDTRIVVTVPEGASMDPASNVYVKDSSGLVSYGYFFQITASGPDPTPTEKYTNNGNGTITQNLSADLAPLTTRRMWQQEDDGVLRTWDDAVAYCDALTLGGHVDWVMPTFTRLLGIVDTTKTPVIDDAFFTNTKSAIYWSSTVSGDGFNAQYIDFTDGSASFITKNSYDQLVRCVRSVPAI